MRARGWPLLALGLGCSAPARPVAPAVAPPATPVATTPAPAPAPCDPTITLETTPTVVAETTEAPDPARAIDTLPATGAVAPASAFGGTWNGSVFERASLRRAAGTKLVVPSHAVVELGAPAGTIELYVEKHLGFAGHPPQPITQASVSRNMGLASRVVNGEQLLSTFGEWDSRVEGSAQVLLLVRVDEGTVTKRAGLAGDGSLASTWPEPASAKENAGRVGYWYGTPNPAPGWTRISGQADARRVARVAGAERAHEAPPPMPPMVTQEQIEASARCTFARSGASSTPAAARIRRPRAGSSSPGPRGRTDPSSAPASSRGR